MLTTPQPKKEHALAERLSVFDGSWTLDAAEAICAGGGVDAAEIRDWLKQLVDKSLVIAEPHAGETRYRFRATMQREAADKLEEGAVLRRRHRDWYLALAERSEVKLWESEQAVWLARLESDHHNFRAALRWSLAEPDGAEPALRLAAALRGFWFQHGDWNEGRRWIESALDRGAGASPSVLARALQAAAFFAYEQGDLDRAEDLGERGLALARTLNDRENLVRLLQWVGKTVRARGDYARAEALFSEGVALAREAESRRQIRSASAELARVYFLRGDYQRANALYADVLASAREDAARWNVAYALWGLGGCAFRLGRHDRAREHYRESLSITRNQRDPMTTWCLEGLADVAAALGHYKKAATLYGVVEASRTSMGKTLPPANQADFDKRLGVARDRLEEDDFAAAGAEGRAMTLEQAIEYALQEGTPAEEGDGSPSNVAPD